MNTKTITTPKLLAASLLALSFLLSSAITHVQASANDTTINIKKELGTDWFTLTIKDPDGLQEFSLSLVGRYAYGGGLSGCKKTFSSNNVLFLDPSDFTPVMTGYVVDCSNNKTELEILPPVNGVANSKVVKKEVPPPPPPKEEKKEGPLSAEDIQYPVSGLGNCQNETECRSYCDIVDNAKACFAFAKAYHLISDEEAQEAADEFLNVKNGPGGCDSGSSCEDYCSTVDHLDECIAFAEDAGYYSPEELAEARKFQALVKAGKQFPGGCKDRNACEIYCGDPNHMEECLNFAEESGFMPPEEIAEARKFMVLMRQGESPGGCTSKEQCENYCFEEDHAAECVDFALKAGVISAEDAEMARKVGGKGPGGCRSKEQCEAYCQDNSDECFSFAKEHGLISEDDLQQMREGMASFREELDKMPPEAVQCMKDAVGEENFNKIANGEPVFDKGMEEKMKSCFGQITAQFSQQLSQLPPETAECIKDAVGEEGLQKLQSGEHDENLNFESLEGCFQQLQQSFGGGGNFGDGGFSGPGGCKTTEECSAYCQEHQQECQGFGPPGDNGGGFQGGPGGCTSPEECQAYCQDNPKECQGFGRSNPGGDGSGEYEMTCSPEGTIASFVCGKNGRDEPPDLEVTYFNSCTAQQHGAEILHDGVCEGHVPCDDIADPVCGNDGNTWVSACYAEEKGGGVKYAGVCSDQPGDIEGPGGCKTTEECTRYCSDNSQECQDYCQTYPYACYDATLPSDDSEAEECVKQGGSWDGGKCNLSNLEQFPQPPQDYQQSPAPSGGDDSRPPQGFSSWEEFCKAQPEDYRCSAYNPQTPSPTNYSGPGGCTNPEECRAYCTQNYQDPACQGLSSFAPPSFLETVLGLWTEFLK